MATTHLRNGALAGAVAGLAKANYSVSDPAVAPATSIATIAGAIADEFITKNAALSVPMADGNAELPLLAAQAVEAVISAGGNYQSTTATDYAQPAAAAVAICKAASAGLA